MTRSILVVTSLLAVVFVCYAAPIINPVDIKPGVVDTNEFATLDGARSSLQAQIDALHPEAIAVTNAASCPYTDETYTNVQDALDALFFSQSYEAPDITSFTGGSTYDIGRTITNVTLSWSINKTVESRVVSGGASVDFGSGGSGNYTVTNALDSTTTTYTLTVDDTYNTDVASTVNRFYHRRYYGFSDVEADITSSSVLELSSDLTTAYTLTTKHLIPTGTQYVWICYPASWGAPSFFYINTLPVDVASWTLETKSFTNAYNYVETFRHYRSPYAYNSEIDVEVR